MVILAMGLEMLGELLDAAGQDSDLDLGRAGIFLGSSEIGDELLFSVFCERHSTRQGITGTAWSLGWADQTARDTRRETRQNEEGGATFAPLATGTPWS